MSNNLILTIVGSAYEAPIVYGPLPDKTTLERRFTGRGSVNALFDGRPWERNPVSGGRVNEIDGIREMRIVRLLPDAALPHRDRHVAISNAMRALGLRDATVHELIAFAEVEPRLQEEIQIAALGSYVLHLKRHYVAHLDCRQTTPRVRLLGCELLENDWQAPCHFLGVKE